MKNTRQQLYHLALCSLNDFVSTSSVVDYYIDYMEERGERVAKKDFIDELTSIKVAYEQGENKTKIKARIIKMIWALTK